MIAIVIGVLGLLGLVGIAMNAVRSTCTTPRPHFKLNSTGKIEFVEFRAHAVINK
jgi:hypothetical protein